MVFCRNTFPGFAGESMLSGSYSFFSGETGKTAVAFATAARLRQQAGASQAKPSQAKPSQAKPSQAKPSQAK